VSVGGRCKVDWSILRGFRGSGPISFLFEALSCGGCSESIDRW
jgi:hypothetical protein